ncbi:MAG: TonB-dependent receptor [Cyclobacteriaceae bacterium]
MRALFLSVLFFALMIGAFAQEEESTKLIKLQIIGSDDNSPVIGATVGIKGTHKGTASDVDGNFSLQANSKDTVAISAVGYETQLVPILQLINRKVIPLKPSITGLDEVVVTGYGSQKRGEFTGAISSVSSKDIESTTALSFDNALAGKAAGVFVNSSSGVPGSATSITIRGLTSLSGDANNPLIVIDGVPVYGTGQDLNTTSFSPSSSGLVSTGGGTRVSSNFTLQSEFERNPLSNLNPADIESVEILKDSYATSIYGSRGAAGVILITTKKGTRGAPRLDLRYSTGVTKPVDTYKLLNGDQYRTILNKYYGYEYVTGTANTNWQDKVIRAAAMKEVGVTMSGGEDKGQYYISGSYTNQPSYIINQDFERYSGRINLNYQSTDFLVFGSNSTITYTENSALNAQEIYYNAVQAPPSEPVFDDNGDYLFFQDMSKLSGADKTNPLAIANKNINTLEDTRVVSTIYGQIDLYDWLALRSEVGIDIFNSHAFSRKSAAPGSLPDGEAIETSVQNRKFVVNNTLTLNRAINGDHNTSVVIGQSMESSTESTLSVSAVNFPNDNIKSIQATNSADRRVRSAITREWALVSYFVRANYHYKNKYLAGVTYRMDGSSRFAANNRYVGFPAFSAGWRLSEEGFLKDVSLIEDLKLRASLGFSGIQGSGFTSYYGFQGQYVFSDVQYGNLGVLEVEQPPNPNIEWQKTQSWDVGVDATLWDGKLDFTVDMYYKRTKNLLFSSTVPYYLGYSSQEQNLGDMKNQGIEFSTNTNFNLGALKWRTSFNVSRNQNKIIKLNQQGGYLGRTPTGNKYLKEGSQAGLFFLYQWVGVDPMTGDPLWRDGDGVVSDNPPEGRWRVDDNLERHRKIYGSNQPDFFGGFNNILTFKNFELNMSFTYSYGNKMFNGSKASLMTYSTGRGNNMLAELNNYWKILGHDTSVPALRNASIRKPDDPTENDATYDYTTSRESSRFLEDGSYVRLKTAQLTYNLPAHILSKTNGMVRTCSIYVRGTNLWTLTKYTGLDPEVSAHGSNALSGGIDELTMPQAQITQIGINLGF